MRKLNLEIIPQGSLNPLSIESTLQDRIIMSQLHDEGIKIVKLKLSQGEAKYKCFHTDIKEFYGSTIILLYPRIINFVNKSLMKHIYINSLFIQVVPKCIKIFDKIYGGLE
jgi:hypothetical protein